MGAVSVSFALLRLIFFFLSFTLQVTISCSSKQVRADASLCRDDAGSQKRRMSADVVMGGFEGGSMPQVWRTIVGIVGTKNLLYSVI